jgi:hypothetical protein
MADVSFGKANLVLEVLSGDRQQKGYELLLTHQ